MKGQFFKRALHTLANAKHRLNSDAMRPDIWMNLSKSELLSPNSLKIRHERQSWRIDSDVAWTNEI